MNEIVNKVLLAGEKFMSEIHLRQLELCILLVEHLQKTRKEFKKWKKNPEDSWYIYQNELDKTCFQQDIAYEDFKDLTRKNEKWYYF